MTISSFLHLWNRNLGGEAENLDKVFELMKLMICKHAWGTRSPESSSLKDEGERGGTNPFALLFTFILFLTFLHKQGCQRTAVLWAEPQARSHWLAPDVGDFRTADRCSSSLSSQTWFLGRQHISDRMPSQEWLCKPCFPQTLKI